MITRCKVLLHKRQNYLDNRSATSGYVGTTSTEIGVGTYKNNAIDYLCTVGTISCT